MGRFSSLMTYAGSWRVKSAESLDEFLKEDGMSSKDIARITIREGEGNFGKTKSFCFHLNTGGQKYLNCSKNCDSLKHGDIIDINSIKILTLSKDGESDIIRVEGKAL